MFVAVALVVFLFVADDSARLGYTLFRNSLTFWATNTADENLGLFLCDLLAIPAESLAVSISLYFKQVIEKGERYEEDKLTQPIKIGLRRVRCIERSFSDSRIFICRGHPSHLSLSYPSPCLIFMLIGPWIGPASYSNRLRNWSLNQALPWLEPESSDPISPALLSSCKCIRTTMMESFTTISSSAHGMLCGTSL